MHKLQANPYTGTIRSSVVLWHNFVLLSIQRKTHHMTVDLQIISETENSIEDLLDGSDSDSDGC